jgi:hypothetical protein
METISISHNMETISNCQSEEQWSKSGRCVRMLVATGMP